LDIQDELQHQKSGAKGGQKGWYRGQGKGQVQQNAKEHGIHLLSHCIYFYADFLCYGRINTVGFALYEL
jgi:hypothetical protein